MKRDWHIATDHAVTGPRAEALVKGLFLLVSGPVDQHGAGELIFCIPHGGRPEEIEQAKADADLILRGIAQVQGEGQT